MANFLDTAHTLTIIAAIISFICDAVTIIWIKCFTRVHSLRNIVNINLLFCFLISDFVGDIIYIIMAALPVSLKTSTSGICVFVAIANTGVSLSKIFWAFAIMANFIATYKYLQLGLFDKHIVKVCLLCWGVAAIFSFALLFDYFSNNAVIADVGLWCWIDSKYVTERIFFYYFWLVLVNVIICLYILYLKLTTGENENILKFLTTQFLFFLLAFFVTWVVSLINRIYDWANYPETSEILDLFQSFFEPLQGAFVCIIYYCKWANERENYL